MTDKYANEIKKTGFVLESKINDILQADGWSVISNKYYEDDFEGNVREIDILAYKVSKIQQVDVYTTLLISCKKSEQDIWALLARPIDLKKPNADWWPLHVWSNDKSLTYHLEKPKIKKTYHEEIQALGVTEVLETPNYEVFAFQEMSRVNGTPRNDTNIFKAVTSLIKAQAYELGVLSGRKKTPSVYQFNLLSIIDSELYRLLINGDEISQQEIDSEHYISKYIIKRQETVSRIRFASASSFTNILKDYSRLHVANKKWFDTKITSFYEEILTDYSRTMILFPEFRAEIGWTLSSEMWKLNGQQLDRDSIGINWNKSGKYAEVYFENIDRYVSILSENEQLKKKVSDALLKIYRYKGEFRFAEDDIPF
ncbi:hypothetical protein INP77_07760 [Methylophilus sp. 13]|uniref:hypothetical protein n=1 Tax=Methylophilus sp. 13 TaxID=2781018 RepID=UPI00188E4101|nr:hypothetical protein [Methylophilus sp. 13]MBF5039383.1 hypothetical protein [Methylophilus sp. 13]